MAIMFFISLFLTLVTSTLAAAPFDTTTAQGGKVSVSVNVPQNTSTDLYFNFVAPSTSSWAAFGFGKSMYNALVFIVYTANNSVGVTVSPRLATGEYQPLWTNNTQLALLNGTGVTDGNFVVNGHCKNCRTWTDGTLDVTSTSASMIWALGYSGDLATNDVEANLKQHDSMGVFNINLSKATGEAGVPVLTSTDSNSNSTTGTGDDDSSDDDSGMRGWAVVFHALIMSAAFIIIFPLGQLCLRLFERVWLHWGIQSLGVFLVVIGTASGISISKRQNISPNLTHPHQIIGLIVLVLAFAAYTLGLIGHSIYKKTGQPAKMMLGHRILGPSTMCLGLINGYVGFSFAGNDRGMIGYAIFSLASIIIVNGLILIKKRRNVRKGAMNTAAAQNFREGAQADSSAPPAYNSGFYPPPQDQGIQMQSYGQRGPGNTDVERQHGAVETIHVQPK